LTDVATHCPERVNNFEKVEESIVGQPFDDVVRHGCAFPATPFPKLVSILMSSGLKRDPLRAIVDPWSDWKIVFPPTNVNGKLNSEVPSSKIATNCWEFCDCAPGITKTATAKIKVLVNFMFLLFGVYSLKYN